MEQVRQSHTNNAGQGNAIRSNSLVAVPAGAVLTKNSHEYQKDERANANAKSTDAQANPRLAIRKTIPAAVTNLAQPIMPATGSSHAQHSHTGNPGMASPSQHAAGGAHGSWVKYIEAQRGHSPQKDAPSTGHPGWSEAVSAAQQCTYQQEAKT